MLMITIIRYKFLIIHHFKTLLSNVTQNSLHLGFTKVQILSSLKDQYPHPHIKERQRSDFIYKGPLPPLEYYKLNPFDFED